MKIIPSDDYNQRLDKHIKDAFKDVLHLTHPCEHQNKNCLKGSECPLIGLPNDVCTYYINGKCKHDNKTSKCKYKHIDLYANTYKKAKEEFRVKESKPTALIERHVRRFIPYIMAFVGFILQYIFRRALDHVGKKIL